MATECGAKKHAHAHTHVHLRQSKQTTHTQHSFEIREKDRTKRACLDTTKKEAQPPPEGKPHPQPRIHQRNVQSSCTCYRWIDQAMFSTAGVTGCCCCCCCCCWRWLTAFATAACARSTAAPVTDAAAATAAVAMDTSDSDCALATSPPLTMSRTDVAEDTRMSV